MNDLSFAERLLQSYGIDRPEDIDLEAVAFDQGAEVIYRHLDGCEARIVGVGSKAIISVNNESIPERQRFSLGHELGHWLQDKGTISQTCTRRDIGPNKIGKGSREALANSFASQILMPDYIFRPLSSRQPLTLETARALGARFRSSVTATAIKLVKTGHFPGMVVCHKNKRYEWHVAGPDIPADFRPLPELDDDTNASALMVGSSSVRASLQSVDSWLDCPNAEDYEVIEDSQLVAPGTTISLLWWKDESQLHARGE